MKKTLSPRTILRTTVIGLLALALTLTTACKTTDANDQYAATDTSSQLAKEMIGTWVHVGAPGRVHEAPAKGGRLKFRTGTHWILTHPDANTGLATEQFGGTYTLKGNEYVETQQFADPMWLHDNGKSFKFTVKVEGDTMTQYGVDNPFTEVWKRVR